MNRRTALGALALVTGLALLAAFYLAISSQTAVLGRRLQKLESERATLQRENAYLRDYLARESSFAAMKQRALADQFVTTGTVLFVPINGNLVPTPVAPASPP
jgi:hypothetical protein